MVNTVVQFRGNFLFFDAPQFEKNIVGECLVLQTDRIHECLKYIEKNDVKSVMINDNYYFYNDLTILSQLINLEGLYVTSDRVDTSQISMCNKLKVLRTDILTAKLDLNNLKGLEVLIIPNYKKISHISSCISIRWIQIFGYDKPDLTELNNLKLIEFLCLNAPQIETLEGVGEMHYINTLELNDAKKLTSLKGLKQSNSKLERLNIWNSKHLSDYTELENVVNIKRLNLRRTGETGDIYFIDKLTKLESVTLGFKIINGDLSPLDKVHDVGFIYFKHYNRKMKDFNR